MTWGAPVSPVVASPVYPFTGRCLLCENGVPEPRIVCEPCVPAFQDAERARYILDPESQYRELLEMCKDALVKDDGGIEELHQRLDQWVEDHPFCPAEVHWTYDETTTTDGCQLGVDVNSIEVRFK